MSNNNITIKYSDFDPQNLAFTPFQDNKTNKGIKLAYPNYLNGQLRYIQGPYFKLNDVGSGIPKLTEQSKEYFPTEKSREFLKVPLDQENVDQKLFTDIFRQIDAYYGSEEFKKNNFEIRPEAYKYVPLIKDIEIIEGIKQDPTKKSAKHPLMKFKFETDHETKLITTIVFKVDKKIRTEVPGIKNIDDLAYHIKYNSKIRIIFRIVKLWANAHNKKDPYYGITIKATKIEVESNAYDKESDQLYKKLDTFIDSDNEDDDDNIVLTKNKLVKQNIKKTSKKILDDDNIKAVKKSIKKVESDNDNSDDVDDADIKPVKKTIKAESDNDNDNDDNDNDDIKPAKKSIKVDSDNDDEDDDIKPAKKAIKKVESDNDDSDVDDDSDIKPAKKTIKKIESDNDNSDDDDIKSAKKSIKVDSDIDESDDDDIKPVKKQVKKSIKKVESDDDDDDDDDDIKPVKKPVKKSIKKVESDDDDDEKLVKKSIKKSVKKVDSENIKNVVKKKNIKIVKTVESDDEDN
jgi:hypothetical protein